MNRLILLAALLATGCAEPGTAPMTNVPTVLLIYGYIAGMGPTFFYMLTTFQRAAHDDGTFSTRRITEADLWFALLAMPVWPLIGVFLSIVTIPEVVLDLAWRLVKRALHGLKWLLSKVPR